MVKNDTNLLLELLSTQLLEAFAQDGVWGEEALRLRRAACEAANSTIAQLEALGMVGEESLEKAEALAFSCNLN